MASHSQFSLSLIFPFLLLLLLLSMPTQGKPVSFSNIREATLSDLQLAFRRNQLTSRQLVEFYIREIHRFNPILKGVLELNPDALAQADRADRERCRAGRPLPKLHGIPILVKDNISTKDKMNTTAGSYALLGSVVPRDAGVVSKLRKAGAIILGKATLSEWSYFRGNNLPSGWSARGGQGKNPYTMGDPCGSSSGSAISVAANLVAVSLGTETDGSILCPSDSNSVVGIKPTVGLTSRDGVVPISQRQDTVGPICRTVSDAAYVLEAIAGVDVRDKATIKASKYVPKGGYTQFLRKDGLRGKRIGIVRYYYKFNGTSLQKTYEQHLKTLRQQGAVLIDNLEIDNVEIIKDAGYEFTALHAEFKIALNSYLKALVNSPVKTLADVIHYNNKRADLEKTDKYSQDVMLAAQKTNGIGKKERAALLVLAWLSKNGIEKVMKVNKLDAVVTSGFDFATVLAIGGYPGITVPAGYNEGEPVGICFSGLRGSEPRLIEIAYSFEQATKLRRPPPLHKLRP
ncbi:probable amidase At4g34880 [Neltuma alba]|uniref:probable amidase At4g34880 n=1 Tax=Neltuma alba TaxID=207710 RepID=UPI0010A566D5|nr:probable amidase At4g34880 [Prosopis alba]